MSTEQTKPKHTIESVTADLKAEFETLSRKTYSVSGDVNYKEYGGVRYRKGSDGDIEIQFYYGLENIPEELTDFQNRHLTYCDLSELIDGLPEIWSFADGANCGFNIGNAISSLQQYNGFLELNP